MTETPTGNQGNWDKSRFGYARTRIRYIGDTIYGSIPQVTNDPLEIFRHSFFSIFLNVILAILLGVSTKNPTDRSLYSMIFVFAIIGDLFAIQGIKHSIIRHFFTTFAILSSVLGIKLFLAIILITNHIVGSYFTNIQIPMLVFGSSLFDFFRLYRLRNHVIRWVDIQSFTQKMASLSSSIEEGLPGAVKENNRNTPDHYEF